jgi:hypothetical protein
MDHQLFSSPDALLAFLSERPLPLDDDVDSSPDQEEVATWLYSAGVTVNRLPAPETVLWAIGTIDYAAAKQSVSFFAAPASVIPEWVRQDAYDWLHLDEIDRTDIEGAIDEEAWKVVAWILTAFQTLDEVALSADWLDVCPIGPLEVEPGAMLGFALSDSAQLGPVVQIIVTTLTLPYPFCTGQDIPCD